MFEEMSSLLRECKIELLVVKELILHHLQGLQDDFWQYFPEVDAFLGAYGWVQDPFSAKILEAADL